MSGKLKNAFVLLLLVPLWSVHASDRPGVAAIASAHPAATAAGHEILEQGGNAFDAAVAVGATLGVVEAFSGGFGGGGFWLLHRAEDGMQVMVDHREVAPAAATRDMYLDDKGQPIPRASRDGPLAAGIPGLPAGLVHVADKYGRLPLAQSLEPAIRAARHGTRVYHRMRLGLEYKQKVLGRSPAARDIFLPDGEVPEIGHVIYQPDLADTMEALAEQGRDGFYAGDVARRMVEGVRAEGGIWTEQDLADYRVIERPPVVFEYRGARIVAAAPPSAGGIALANILNILSGYRLDALDRVSRVHVSVEAMRRAYRDRAEYLGDPDFVDIPVERLTHPLYAAGQRTSIRMDRATPSDLLPGYLPEEGGADTTHFSIIDTDGNRVAGTQSINSWFGSGFMPPGTGVLLNNEMDDFAIKPGVENLYQLVGAVANSVEPGKRMLSSMTPTFVESDRGVLILGTPGGSRIITMILLGILKWLDGANVEEIAALPRFHHQYMPDKLFFEEKAFDADERRALEEKGHTLQKANRLYGNMQAVSWEFESGEVQGASDPRNEGGATVRVY